MGKAGH
jgi:hypothetical protein